MCISVVYYVTLWYIILCYITLQYLSCRIVLPDFLWDRQACFAVLCHTMLNIHYTILYVNTNTKH